MIKVENIEVFNFEGAIRGMRNPLNSWGKSDSYYCDWGMSEYCDKCGKLDADNTGVCESDRQFYCIGKNDLDLMQRLFKAGTEHRKYLRQIFVSMDITAPQYWFFELDTYKVGTTTNSCSKMHKLLSKPFEMNDFSFDKLPGYRNEIIPFVPELSEEEIALERWEPIADGYEISNLGRCKHIFEHHYRIISGSKHCDGYIFVTLHGKQYPIHRLVAEKFCENNNPHENLVVNHKDGNKQNNHADNLEWVTQSENIKHSFQNHFQPTGITTYTGKFSEAERKQIKEEWDEGLLSKRQLAKKYNVSHTCINSIINDKYKYAEKVNLFEEIARPIVDDLNELRDSYFRAENEQAKKDIWYSILELLPISYNQRRTVTMSYENVFTIIKQRSGHKLTEWNDFVEILKTLPYVKEIGGFDEKEGDNNEH